MAAIIKQIDGGLVTPKDDAVLHELFNGQCGVLKGCAVTYLGANQIKIGAGYAYICGRLVEIAEETLLSPFSENETGVEGEVVLKVDILAETPAELIARAPRQELVQQDINEDGTVYEYLLATYTVTDVSISGLAVKYKIISSTETVDPMLATEAGFAADAKATGDALKSQNSNIQGLQTQLAQVSDTANQAFGQASDGKSAIANALSGKGVSASASETFASLASKITNNLYKPPTYLSGTVSFNNVSAGQYSQHVTFSTAFGPVPKVTVATNYPDTSTVSAYNITRNGFDVKLTSTFSGKGYYTVTWTASA